MKKIVLAAFVALSFAIYSVHARQEAQQATAAVASVPAEPRVLRPNDDESLAQTTTTSPTPQSGTPTSSMPMTTSSSRYNDGTYTGTSANAIYGNIQVQAIIKDGKIVDVVFLQYPHDRPASRTINSQAMPSLKQEVIAAQSAQVDGVSGATDTSQAFIESLGVALQQALHA